MFTESAERVIDETSDETISEYREYWKGLTPKDPNEKYKRWLFAYASVNSGVAANLYLYEYLERLPTPIHSHMTLPQLTYRLRRYSRGGMHVVRGKGIWRFSKSYWDDDGSEWWGRLKGESWVEARKRISARAFGLADAKTAFGLELVSPTDCRVVCLDRHMLRLYGLDRATVKPKEYDQAEAHWSKYSRSKGHPPTLTRHAWWDRRRKPVQTSTRYWSYVFEGKGSKTKGTDTYGGRAA